MPVVGVGRDRLFERLGDEYSKFSTSLWHLSLLSKSLAACQWCHLCLAHWWSFCDNSSMRELCYRVWYVRLRHCSEAQSPMQRPTRWTRPRQHSTRCASSTVLS